MTRFETGPVVMTYGIRDIIESNPKAAEAVRECLERHCRGDWGDLCDEDKELNEQALENEIQEGVSDQLFSSYEMDFGKIYIITEADRSVTTILLPEEY